MACDASGNTSSPIDSPIVQFAKNPVGSHTTNGTHTLKWTSE